jgi:5,10-methylenetetrahydromethanopterin reductase
VRFSIRLNNDLPIEEYVAIAQAAEAVGFDQLWVSHDLFLRSAPVILSACALVTERIQLGTCILNPYTLHPAEIAMVTATLDELSGNRFKLGLSAGAGEFLKWVGIEQERPLSATRVAIEQLQAVLAGEAAPGWEPEAYLRMPARRTPIYLGATSPRMLRLAGELADGALPLLFPPEHYATVVPLIAEGALQAGRSLDDIDIAACVWCSISDNRTAAEDALKDKIAYYAQALSGYLKERLGLDEVRLRALEHAVMTERDPAAAREMVTPEMLRIGIVGAPDDIVRRLKSLVAMGVRHLSFGPPLGPDPLQAVLTLGREVLPHFRE